MSIETLIQIFSLLALFILLIVTTQWLTVWCDNRKYDKSREAEQQQRTDINLMTAFASQQLTRRN